jgi:hypothetical protein
VAKRGPVLGDEAGGGEGRASHVLAVRLDDEEAVLDARVAASVGVVLQLAVADPT